MKISVISFDHWNYDHHIVNTLKNKGIESNHINIGKFKHRNSWEQFKNTISKIFLNTNPKKKKRQDFILETLSKLGHQDQILVINPEIIEKKYHLEIKKYTSNYMAYLYDSVARCPVEPLLDGIFDTIYSFDPDDVKKYSFQKITNYIYFDKKSIPKIPAKFQAFYIASFDKRMTFLQTIAKKFDDLGISYHFIIVGKKVWKTQLIASFIKTNKAIMYRRKRINQIELGAYYNQTNVIIDIVRAQQSGLSFRIFEALGYQKKIITNNSDIQNYDFYNPKNIQIIDSNSLEIDCEFFQSEYEPIPDSVYGKYTLDYWVDTVFNLKKQL